MSPVSGWTDGLLWLGWQGPYDGGGGRELLAKLPVLQGQLVDDTNEGFAVGAEFGELLSASPLRDLSRGKG